MGYTSTYIHRDNMSSVSRMGSRGLNPILLKGYRIFYELGKN